MDRENSDSVVTDSCGGSGRRGRRSCEAHTEAAGVLDGVLKGGAADGSVVPTASERGANARCWVTGGAAAAAAAATSLTGAVASVLGKRAGCPSRGPFSADDVAISSAAVSTAALTSSSASVLPGGFSVLSVATSTPALLAVLVVPLFFVVACAR